MLALHKILMGRVLTDIPQELIDVMLAAVAFAIMIDVDGLDVFLHLPVTLAFNDLFE